jgi:phospholipid/cholesterol/gamma-HCH transport system substrate-binding protein
MTWFRRHVRPYLQHIAALFGMIVISLGVALYVTTHQRLRFPWQEEMQIYAEFDNAQAVTAGQGQTVDVAGVQVGEIGSVQVEDGHALVRLDITKEDEVGAIYSNAKLFLRPKTGLNDMAVQMDPGEPDPSLPDDGRLEDGDRIPIANTQANVNPDQVLAALDTDTRRYLQVLLNAGAGGLRGRSADLRAILKASQPTLGHARKVSAEVADRREKVKRLIHNLRLLAGAAADRDEDLRSLTSAASAVLTTLGERDAELQDAVGRLPGALSATREALVQARGFAGDARPALTALRPLARELAPDLRAARPLLREALPVVRDDLRPLVREATPLLVKLRPSVEKVDAVTAPDLIEVGKILNRTVNVLGFNPEGKEEGFLFHTAWYAHNAASIVSLGDAHGVAWRGLVMGSCSTFPDVVGANPALLPLTQLPICGFGPGGGGSPIPALPKTLTPQALVERAKAPETGEAVR